MTTESKYYQYQMSGNYPIYLRFDSSVIEEALKSTLANFGFIKLEETALKKIMLNRFGTKVLKITKASSRVIKQIKSFSGMDQYGDESLTPMGSYEVYRYRNIGMMMIQENNMTWELGLISEVIQSSERQIKTILTRFLAASLAPLGIVGFWGSIHENSFIITKMNQGQGNAFFIDYKNRKVLGDKETDLFHFDQIIRIDESLKGSNRLLSKEEMIGFMTANTALFSYKGLDQRLKHYCYELASELEGVVVPKDDYTLEVQV